MADLPSTFVAGFHDEASVRKMEYLPLGKTGLRLSRVSIGGATLAGFFGTVDEDEAIRTIRKAIRSGINYIDTAPWYGQGKSEELIGRALEGVPREAYYVATKIGRYEKDVARQMNYTAEKTRQSVARSLELLKLKHIDVIQIHDVEFAERLEQVVEEALPALEQLRAEGKVRFIGVTGYPLDVLKKTIQLAGPGRFDSVLAYSRYSLIDDELVDYMPFFAEQQLGVICAAGHALGLLTNAGARDWHPADEKLRSMCKRAADICRAKNIELGKLAMYFFQTLPGAATFLVGMHTETLLDINLNAFYNGLTAEEQEVLEHLRKDVLTPRNNWEGVELRTIFGRF